MAEQMQDTKRRIKSVTSTERITNAMKLVSASKLRRAKNVYEHSKGFLDDIFESMADALNYAENVPAEYVDLLQAATDFVEGLTQISLRHWKISLPGKQQLLSWQL